MKRILAFSLVLVLALSLLACGKQDNDTGKRRDPSSGHGTPSGTPAPTDAPDITVTPTDTPTPTPKLPVDRADASVLPLTLFTGSADHWLPYGEEALLRIAGPRVTYDYLNEDDCIAGLNALQTFFEAFQESEKKFLRDYENKTGLFEGKGPVEGTFNLTLLPEVVRADTNVLSGKVLYNGKLDTFSGDIVYTANYDAKTGKVIDIDDLIANKKDFFLAVTKQLLANETGAKLQALGAEADLLTKVSGYEPTLCFAVGYEGVTVFFNPGMLSSSEHGIYSTTVFYNDHPELFIDKYTKVPVNYGIGAMNTSMKLDGVMNGNITLNPYKDDYGYIIGLSIEVWQLDSEGKLQLTCKTKPGFDDNHQAIYISPYYVRHDGKDYLLLGAIGSYESVYVYEINSKEKTMQLLEEQLGWFEIKQSIIYAPFEGDEFSIEEPEILEVSYLDLKSFDPEDFILLSKSEMIGCFNVANQITFDHDGKLHRKNEIRPIQDQFQFRGDLKAPLTGPEVLELNTYRSNFSYTPGTQTISLEAGRNYIPLAFLGENKLILFYMDPTGVETNQYIMVTLEKQGDVATINGVSVYDIFVNLFESY